MQRRREGPPLQVRDQEPTERHTRGWCLATLLGLVPNHGHVGTHGEARCAAPEAQRF